MPTFTGLAIENPVQKTHSKKSAALLEFVEVVTFWGVVSTSVLLLSLTWVH